MDIDIYGNVFVLKNGYRKGTSIRQAPVFRHLRALITEKPMEVYYLD